MDFYEAQAQARRRTRRLVLGFALAIVVVVAALTVVTLFLWPPFHPPVHPPFHPPLQGPSSGPVAAAQPDEPPPRVSGQPFTLPELVTHDPDTTRSVALSWLLVLLLPVLYRTLTLARSGAVARWLGGTLLPAEPEDAQGRMLRNVVEEMSIASGVPVPRIYMLHDEPSINAFAAGFHASDATLAVTGGALRALDRDQLQGVIAHEFSHILNGDMRMNVRLIAWVAGLFTIANLPLRIVRAIPHGKIATFLYLLMLPVTIVGALGGVLGRLLQAAVSRQREWLADASAVQFTRNPDGLRRALITVSRQPGSSLMRAQAAQEAAHLFFVPAVRRCISTHPSLQRRIQALDKAARAAPSAPQRPWRRDEPSQEVARTPPVDRAAAVASQAGEVPVGMVDRARALLEALPEAVRQASLPGEAEAVLLAVALSSDGAVQGLQAQAIESAFGPQALARVLERREALPQLPARLRLPAVQHLLPRVRELAAPRRELLRKLLSRIALADGQLDLFEFCLARLASTWLRDGLSGRQPAARQTLAQLSGSAGALLSALAVHGHPGDVTRARQAFAAGASTLDRAVQPGFEPLPDWAPTLWRAFDHLDRLAYADRRAVVEAMAAVILHDGRVEEPEIDLLRTACAVLHCPLPLLEPGLLSPAGGLTQA